MADLKVMSSGPVQGAFYQDAHQTISLVTKQHGVPTPNDAAI